MKRVLILFVAILASFTLIACDSNQIPDDAVVATCPQGDTFKYIYKDDRVYEFYSNDVLQDKSMLDIVQNAADGYDSVQAYIDATFQTGVCAFTPYVTGGDKG